MHYTRVLALIVLLVGLVHSISWDIVVGRDTQLDFYYNGTLTQTENIPSAWITSVTYDPVHNRLLFADKLHSTSLISSFDLLTNKTQYLVTTAPNHFRVVYDFVTQAVYWRVGSNKIHSYSLNPESSNQRDGNLIVTLKHNCRDLAVDSCGGYIYWITDYDIERARVDGSGREVLIDSTVYYRLSLAIDHQTQKMYWTEKIYSSDNQWSIESANFNGKNRTTVYIVRNTYRAFSLAVSKDFIYWQNYNEQGIWQLSKYSSQTVTTKLYSTSSSHCFYCHRIATNYAIKGQSQGMSCDPFRGVNSNDSKTESTVSVCQNYCIQGECSVSAEEQPTCSCKAGYSGERCEVNACHKHCLNGGNCSLNEEGKPTCQCTAGYDGERCDVSICKDYCFQGNCSVGAEGQPKCSCVTGYSGERCEVSIYKDYCFQGNYSIGAEGQPKCSCKTGYSGERCEVNTCCYEYCLNGGVYSFNDEDTADYDSGRCEVSADKDNRSDAGNSGEGTVSACHQFCLNDGTCSLNEASEPVCLCTADYVGERCDIPASIDEWVLHAYD